jgi:hypothetical protein
MPIVASGYLIDNIKLTKVKDHSAAATSAVNGDGVDMTGYDGVLFFTSFGTAASNNTVNLAQSDDDGSSDDYTDLEGTSVASGTSDEDVWVDFAHPTKKYVRLEAARGTSSTLESIWAIQYNARALPVTNVVSGTIIGEKHNAEAEGTA